MLAFGVADAAAEELATPPSQFINERVPYLSWSGFYAGINAGYAWGNSSVTYLVNDPAAQIGVGAGKTVPSVDFYRDGPLAGGQIGFNWQVNSHWLIGGEADYQWSNLDGTRSSQFHLANVGAAAALSTMNVEQTVQSFGTIRARAGVVLLNSLLLYGTGGLGFADVKQKLNLVPAATSSATVTSGGFSYTCTAGVSCFSGSGSSMRVGWTAGLGVEYAILVNLTFKTELLYLHLDAPNVVVAATNPGAFAPASYTASFPSTYFAVVRAGFNYRF